MAREGRVKRGQWTVKSGPGPSWRQCFAGWAGKGAIKHSDCGVRKGKSIVALNRFDISRL